MAFKIDSLVLNNATNVPNNGVVSARHKLEQIEAYIIVITIFIAFLVVFGSYRRRSHSVFLKILIWIAYVLPTYLITYTFGQMQSASFENELFVIWAIFLLIFSGNADCISAYSLQDNENQRRYKMAVLVKYYGLAWLMGTYSHETKFMIPLYIFAFLRTSLRSEALTLASRTDGLVRNTKLIADFMANEHTFSNENEVDPSCMKGYKYWVEGVEKEDMEVIPPLYQYHLKTANEVVTIEMIWQCQGSLLSSTGDSDGRLKDICLSCALFRLLCRRFAGYSMSERSQLKTWNFVRHGLLAKEGDHERAFRVIEVELAFLYDFFYTNYYALSTTGFSLFKSMQLLIIIIGCVIAAPMLKHYHTPNGDLNLLTVSGRDVDVRVTAIVIGAILFMEVVQFSVVNFSDWAKVQWLCSYVKNPSWQNNKFIEKIIQIVCHKKWLKPWEQKLGQYDLLKSFNHNPSNSWASPYIDISRKGQKESSRIKLSLEVKKAIIASLKANEQQLNNGETSLERNGVKNELSWACRLETQTHVIMVWHIATCLCEINWEQANLQRESEHFIVATALSKYCAYLVAFAPRFLPDHAYITEFMFDQVVQEARDKLQGCNSPATMYDKMMRFGEDDHPGETIIKRGAVLGKQLLVDITDNELRWKILADFWADMMLFVSPSDDTTVHAEHLTKGGEFVTHLWALLSHAGILNRDLAQNV
ncbi:uncharacterized protein LOC115972758 [Quercus lobata]|uniref:DUF4220 domain-containing protein n=1 Tax=Quercus lobata TaxID=97700 RepID=A0A7N2N7D3_QUELO|nr:uncharacterized protein LOC115972758 [Quercus lobata]